MNELKLTARGYMYRLLSNFFANELTCENVESIKTGDTARLMEALGQIDAYAPVIERIKNFFAEITDTGPAALDLAESYAWLFHGVAGSRDAPLTASVYLSLNGNLFQEPEREIAAILRSHEIAYVNQSGEPCDHLSVILEVVSWLDEKAQVNPREDAWTQMQIQVIEKYLLSWLPVFCERCCNADSVGFYADLAKDTLDFVTNDFNGLICSCEC